MVSRYIPDLVRAMEEGNHDVVSGTRYGLGGGVSVVSRPFPFPVSEDGAFDRGNTCVRSSHRCLSRLSLLTLLLVVVVLSSYEQYVRVGYS